MTDLTVVAALTARGLPETGTLEDLIAHERANAALAATFDASRLIAAAIEVASQSEAPVPCGLLVKRAYDHAAQIARNVGTDGK